MRNVLTKQAQSCRKPSGFQKGATHLDVKFPSSCGREMASFSFVTPRQLANKATYRQLPRIVLPFWCHFQPISRTMT